MMSCNHRPPVLLIFKTRLRKPSSQETHPVESNLSIHAAEASTCRTHSLSGWWSIFYSVAKDIFPIEVSNSSIPRNMLVSIDYISPFGTWALPGVIAVARWPSSTCTCPLAVQEPTALPQACLELHNNLLESSTRSGQFACLMALY